MTVTGRPDPIDELAGLLTPRPILSPSHHANKLARSLHSGRIADLLREAIIDGELPAGTPLVEMRLAERLSVSRGPIRSALHVLQGEGLVETLPNGRTISSGLNSSDLRDLFGVRFELESLGIRQGVERGASLEPVRKAMEAIESEGASTVRLVDLDVDFHRSLVAFSGSRFLVQSWLAIAPVIQAVITIGNRRLAEKDPASNYARIVDSHRRLVEAIGAGAIAEATALLADQFSLTQSMFITAKEDTE
jgi:GntR family transcriptional regulator, gluconate operon transcriptional repressor